MGKYQLVQRFFRSTRDQIYPPRAPFLLYQWCAVRLQQTDQLAFLFPSVANEVIEKAKKSPPEKRVG